MLKYLASKNGEELKWVYFDTAREAFDHLVASGNDMNECSVTLIDLWSEE